MVAVYKVKPMPISFAQTQFRQLKCWLRGYCAGRGAGKTRIGAVSILRTAKNGDSWMVVSPDNNMIRETTLPTFIDVGEFTEQIIRSVVSPTPRAWFRTIDGGKAEVVFKGAEVPDKLRGSNRSGIWFDEASIISEEAFQLGIATCRRNGVMGPCFATFTPRGFKHWTFERFYSRLADHEVAKHGDNVKWFQGRPYLPIPNTALVHSRTRDNPFLPQEFEATIGGNYSSILGMQELGGEFVEISGLIFKREWFRLVNDVPIDAARVRFWDKACLIAGTHVTTLDGYKPIEEVKPGDSVLTRDGFKKVLNAFLTKRTNEIVSVIFSNGSVLTGTSCHKVWTKNRSWVELGSLNHGDLMLGEPECQESILPTRMSSSTGTSTPRKQGDDTTRPCYGIRSSRKALRTHCTELSGGSTTEIYPLATISTTRTATQTTTTSVILSACHRKTTSSTTQTLISRELRSLILSTERKQLALFGSGLRKTGERQSSRRWHEREAKNLGINCPTATTFASTAKRASSLATASRQTSVRLIAQPSMQLRMAGKPHQNHTGSVFAKTAARSSWVRVDARRVVTHVSKSYAVPVYDLSVADQHEFFAEGILVHNCTPDGGCYTVGTLMARDRKGLFYVEDVVRGQWGWHDRNEIIHNTCRQDFIKYGGTVLTFLEQEGGDSKAMVDQLICRLAEFPVYRSMPNGGQMWKHKQNLRLPGDAKVRRAMPFAGQAQAGNVFVKSAHFTSEWFDEVVSFPEYAFADQVDSASSAYQKLAQTVPDHLYADRTVQEIDVSPSYGESVKLEDMSRKLPSDLFRN